MTNKPTKKIISTSLLITVMLSLFLVSNALSTTQGIATGQGRSTTQITGELKMVFFAMPLNQEILHIVGSEDSYYVSGNLVEELKKLVGKKGTFTGYIEPGIQGQSSFRVISYKIDPGIGNSTTKITGKLKMVFFAMPLNKKILHIVGSQGSYYVSGNLVEELKKLVGKKGTFTGYIEPGIQGQSSFRVISYKIDPCSFKPQPISVTGKLKYNTSQKKYTLFVKKGTEYSLTGSSSKLTGKVDKNVKVTGAFELVSCGSNVIKTINNMKVFKVESCSLVK
jgi:hypothetical protein